MEEEVINGGNSANNSQKIGKKKEGNRGGGKVPGLHPQRIVRFQIMAVK